MKIEYNMRGRLASSLISRRVILLVRFKLKGVQNPDSFKFALKTNDVFSNLVLIHKNYNEFMQPLKLSF